MPLPNYRMAEMVAKVLNISVEVVWNIIRNMKTTNLKKLIDAVRKALRI